MGRSRFPPLLEGGHAFIFVCHRRISMISVVIVDDHVVVRKGLRLLLEQQPDLTVVGAGGNGEQVVAAVRAAATGESRLHPMVAARLLREVQQRDRSPLGELTPRELEVLAQIARGRSNQEIATELSVSERTVKTHVSNILSKLHLADRTQAAIYALQQRLVPLKQALENE